MQRWLLVGTEDVTLDWFGELGYSLLHGHEIALGQKTLNPTRAEGMAQDTRDQSDTASVASRRLRSAPSSGVSAWGGLFS